MQRRLQKCKGYAAGLRCAGTPSTRPSRTSTSSGSPTNAGPAPTPATMEANAMFPCRGASDDPTGVPGAAVTNAGATADEGLAAARALGRIAQQTQKGLCVTHGGPPRLQRWRAGTVTDGGDTAAGASSTTIAESTVCGTVSAKGSETATCATSTSMTPIPVAVPARAAADAILTGEGGSSKSVAAAAPNAEGEKTFSSTSILLGRAPSTNGIHNLVLNRVRECVRERSLKCNRQTCSQELCSNPKGRCQWCTR